MVLRPIQMLLECASRNSKGQADILGRDIPGKFIVTSLEGREEGTRLLLRELRQEEGRRQRAACSVPARGSSFRDEPRVGKPVEERARVRPILQDQGDEGLPALPSDWGDDVCVLLRQGRNRLLFVLPSVQEQGEFLTGTSLVKDLAPRVSEFLRAFESRRIADASKEKQSAKRVGVDREAGAPQGQVLQGPGRAGREGHVRRHRPFPRFRLRRGPMCLEGNRVWLHRFHGHPKGPTYEGRLSRHSPVRLDGLCAAKTVLQTRMHVTPELYERMIGLEA